MLQGKESELKEQDIGRKILLSGLIGCGTI
jgi:hypothetical protein